MKATLTVSARPASAPARALSTFARACLLAAGLMLAAGPALAQAQAPAAQPAAPKKPAPAQPAAPKPALGAQDDGPSRTTATYDDWVVRCERTELAGGSKVCEAAQTLQIGTQQQGLVAQVVFGKIKSDAPLRLVLQLPVGVWLPAGAQLTVGDNAKPISAGFKFCIRACIADVDLTAPEAASLSTATGSASITFQDRNQQQVTIPVSLKGLSAALAARDKM
ncbi:invasion associated locus B family protein [Aquabacter sp. L1I39]|uniref:invasion associated locus B family protein n=1 Tax=Aquabacter sp. L1I39 TaxID=2820278 RepID=UPI001ADA29A8|nr:invasion associated locus B family protein [Aquabacter sp. L1I39]QTL02745.1 invasion associated locus B family protein [Aquabacter sp. L1I39]